MAIRRKGVTVAVNGAELLRLASRAREAHVSIPAHVRMQCGLPPWISRGAERGDVAPPQPAVRRALERHTISIQLTEPEYAALKAEASLPKGPGITVSQYVRTRCGFRVRYVSNPRTTDRDIEEDEAWEILDRLGLNADDYFDD